MLVAPHTLLAQEEVDPKRVFIRDVRTYCGIVLDDNNRKPICRLWFNTSKKYVGLFDEHKKEERVPIGDLDEIFGLADRLKATVRAYDE